MTEAVPPFYVQIVKDIIFKKREKSRLKHYKKGKDLNLITSDIIIRMICHTAHGCMDPRNYALRGLNYGSSYENSMIFCSRDHIIFIYVRRAWKCANIIIHKERIDTGRTCGTILFKSNDPILQTRSLWNFIRMPSLVFEGVEEDITLMDEQKDYIVEHPYIWGNLGVDNPYI